MTDKKHKYIKFEKLSDAVKAYESGDCVYYERGKDWYFQKTGNTFSMKRDYYRREEVKPFECCICVNTDYSYIEIISCTLSERDLKEGYKIIRVREIIE